MIKWTTNFALYGGEEVRDERASVHSLNP